MINDSISLALGPLAAEVLPRRGGVLSSLLFRGNTLLTTTNWSDNIPPYDSYAADEATWVERWSGGWQLCAPNIGFGDLNSSTAAFHGAASQDVWKVTDQSNSFVELFWESQDRRLNIVRRWQLTNFQAVRVDTELTNLSGDSVAVAVAEHLILGSDFLQPLTSHQLGTLEYCSEAGIGELDYTGAPLGQVTNENKSDLRWSELSQARPATVFAITHPSKKSVSASIAGWRAQVDWEGLDHALIWQEFGYSQEAPWHGQVFALGIEPTNVPHGLGANAQEGPFLPAGQSMRWSTTLSFEERAEAK